MNRVLIISPLFPPEGGGSTRRVCAYSKYLPRFGWTPIILTPSRKQFNFPDFTLLSEGDGSTRVIRPPYLDLQGVVRRIERHLPSPASSDPEKMSNYVRPLGTNLYPWLRRWILMPDELITWIPEALRHGRKILSRLHPRAVISIGPNHSMHLLAHRLNKRVSIPWIADFKDPWTTNPFVDFASTFHRIANRLMEKLVLQSCSIALTVSGSIARDLKRIHPSLSVEVLPNGFDPEELSSVPDARCPGLPLRIIHAGAIYGKRTPTPFLEVLCRLKREGIGHRELKVTFLGAGDKATERMVETFRVADMVDVSGHVDHGAALEAIGRNDICLLLPGPGRGTLTGKVFEYLALKRPILCVGGKGGDMERLLREAGGSPPFQETDTDGIVAQLLHWIETKRKGLRIEAFIKDEKLTKFDRREQVRTLAGILDRLAGC